MGLLSSSVSLTRYKVEGELPSPVIESVAGGLSSFRIREIDNEPVVKTAGWTSVGEPLVPDFEGSSFVFGTHFVFSLRVDAKSIPAPVIKKYTALESARKMKESGRDYLARDEKSAIKEAVMDQLAIRIPARPSAYDIIWRYEDARLWFFSHQKAANEEMETLFTKSFGLKLIRLFPYTLAEFDAGLPDDAKDRLGRLTPGGFLQE